MQKIIVRNTERDELISDIMEQTAQCAGGERSVSRLESGIELGTKDLGIIEEIIIAMAKTALLEMLKYVIQRMKKRSDYDGRKKIEIDGKIYMLQELDEKEDSNPKEKAQ